MIVGIDGNEANIKERVGVHQYAFEIIWALYKLQDIKSEGIQFIVYLKKPPMSDLPKENDYWKYKVIHGGSLWVIKKLTPYLYSNKQLDVFFTPSHYLPLVFGLPKICTIHDLGYLKFSEQFKKYDFWQLKYWSAISIYISKYIICPSNATASDVVRRYNFASKKCRVVYHGYDRDKFNPDIERNFVRQIQNKYRIDKKYLLFLSTLKPSKNIEGLIDAFSIVSKKYSVNLVIAGKKGWLYDSIFEKVNKLGLKDKIIFTGYVPDEDKPGLIKGSRAFILPSFWEGFGMDILHAMACGTPVVVSKVASMPEVAGNAGLYIDPYNITSIVKALEKVLNINDREYNKISKLSQIQARKFSWKMAGKETLKVIKEGTR